MVLVGMVGPRLLALCWNGCRGPPAFTDDRNGIRFDTRPRDAETCDPEFGVTVVPRKRALSCDAVVVAHRSHECGRPAVQRGPIVTTLEPVEQPPLLRIGIVEDHETQVLGVESVLQKTSDLRLVASAATVAELLHQTTELDLCVLDLRLADGSTPRSNVAQLRAAGIAALVLTTAEEPFLVQSAAQAGVLGVVRKSITASDLQAAIRAAASGQQVTTMDWAAAIDLDDAFVVKLSPRQQEVLSLYAMGESAVRVAEKTGLSTDTVNQYLSRIRQKYSEAGHPAPTKADLVRNAIATGVAPVPRGLWRRRRK